MRQQILTMLAAIMLPMLVQAKTLIAYYSYTNNVERIVTELRSQIEADVIEIEPAEKGLDYAANNYALGTQLLTAIRDNPGDASSYPAIDPVEVNMEDYDMVIIAVPLWWSQMAAPFQTFLFHYGPRMAGKNIGVIVSSASSGISGVVADAKRLIPDGNFVEPNLWIRSSQTSNARSLVAAWLEEIHYNDLTAIGSVSVSGGGDLEIGQHDRILSVNRNFNTLALYDISGGKLIDTSGNQINASCLNPGIYIVKASADSEIVTRKVHLR